MILGWQLFRYFACSLCASPGCKSRALTCHSVAGTAGAMLTCPLEVVKTRLQSSVASFQPPSPVYVPPPVAVGGAGLVSGGATPHCRYSTCPPSVCTQTVRSSQANTAARPGIYTCLRYAPPPPTPTHDPAPLEGSSRADYLFESFNLNLTFIKKKLTFDLLAFFVCYG